MKKIYMLLILILLTGCKADTEVVEDETLDLSGLPYYSYISDDNPVVTITVKDYGDLKLQLFPNVAKNTVNNFINYIQQGSYANSTFHRIIEDFMVQGGIVTQNSCSIKGEFSSNGVTNSLSHQRGVISMARTNVKDSATSQFFIVHKQSDFLDGNYASFGGLISGFEILDQLATASTNQADAPTKNITIKEITVELNGYIVGQTTCAS